MTADIEKTNEIFPNWGCLVQNNHIWAYGPKTHKSLYISVKNDPLTVDEGLLEKCITKVLTDFENILESLQWGGGSGSNNHIF